MNVMMALIKGQAIICLDTFVDKYERKNVINQIRKSGKEIFTITEEQVTQFEGNMLQVVGSEKKLFIVMSISVYMNLDET